MKTLLSRKNLNAISRKLYRKAEAVFYKVTPADGETEIAKISSGFVVVRERVNSNRREGVRLIVSSEAAIERSALNTGASVALTIDGNTTRYAIDELLPAQQLGGGFIIRLLPQSGATA